ncbi:sugar kinase [Companilactobacillus sp. FL22-1]|uniref:sugar kinase n=1 Tax=Companilactobacillus sp. FL22-1 TaxID=3373892 RepID=UPI0037549339
MNILAFGEVMLRFTVADKMMLEQTDNLQISTVGTGVNLLSSLAHLGYNTAILTTLPDNPVGKKAAADIRKLGINDKRIIFKGQNMGSFFVELGEGPRPERVTYQDRLSSSFCCMNPSQYDFEKALSGINIVHICGISLSLSKKTREAAFKLAKEAKSLDKIVCFDFNYRQNLNDDNSHEAMKQRYQAILPYTDIVFGSERDLTDLLDYSQKEEQELYQTFCSQYKIRVFAGSKRSFSDGKKYFEGFLYHQDHLYKSEPKILQVLDRIGSGDAFASGIITGLIEKWDYSDVLDFAVANSLLAQASMNDTPILEKSDVFNYIDNQGKNDLLR